MIAKIAVSAANFAIDKPYSYFVPAGMDLEPGCRVTVSFGRGNRKAKGVVLSVEDGDGTGLKAVEQKLDDGPVLSPTMLRLAAFIRDRYFCTFFDAIQTMLPAGAWFQTKETFSLTEDRTWTEKPPRQKDALQLLVLLEQLGGEADGNVLRQSLSSEEDYEKAIAYLLKKKWISGQQEFLRRASDKTEKIATLASSQEEAMAYAASRPKSAVMQKNVLELLCSVGSAAVKEICYFTGAKPGTVKRLAELGYVQLSEREVLRCREIVPAQLDGELILNPEQQVAYQGLCAQMAQPQPGTALLYGITGSGKTSVYIQMIRACLAKGKQAMLLVPEIALTPQLLGLMAAYFGQEVAILHSSLGTGERYDQWKRVRSGEAKVVVGTRSAVFAPCPNLGLIILDEEQEHSYKSENAPRYDARTIAQWRGLKENALVLFGSATPSIESMYYAETGRYRLYTLSHRYNGRALPGVEIVDMRQELEVGNDLSLSMPLRCAIRETADSGKQTILFLNRRGNSRAMVCVDCRQSPECPRCSARLTYHSANERLMCHYCGFSQPAVERCPQCGGPVKRVGTGTQKVQEELRMLFNTVTYVRDGSRYYSSKYDRRIVEANVRKAFCDRRSFTTTEELIPQESSLLNIANFTSTITTTTPEDYYPKQDLVERIILDDKGKLKVDANTQKLMELAEATGNTAILEMLRKQSSSHPQKNRSFHYLPYRTDSSFEQTFLEQVLAMAEIEKMDLEVYYNGDRAMTEFKIKCYTGDAGAWRYVGMYTPDFLIVKRKDGKIHKAIIVETKGAIYANDPTFKDKRSFMEREFTRQNNKTFGYERFEYLYLEDSFPEEERIRLTHEKICAFFKEVDE